MISLGGILFWIISCYGIGSLWDRLTQLFWIVNMLGNHQDFCSLRYRCFFCCLKNPPLSSWNFLQLPTTARLLRPPEPDSPPSHFLRSMISGTASMTMSTSCWEKRGQVAGKRRCFFWNRWKIYTCVKRNDSYMHIKNIYLHVFIYTYLYIMGIERERETERHIVCLYSTPKTVYVSMYSHQWTMPYLKYVYNTFTLIKFAFTKTWKWHILT